MLSRVADALYWMSRYVERAENSARILNVHVQLNMEVATQDRRASQEPWEAVISTFEDRERFRTIHEHADSDAVMDYVIFEPRNPNSVLSCIARARENARTIREQITAEMWEQLNKIYLKVRSEGTKRHFQANSFETLREFIEASQLFQGITDSTMTHGEGWQFIRLGRYTGRGDNTSRILDLKYHMLLPSGETVGGNIDTLQWMAVLRSCSALDSFLKRYVGQVTPWHVAKFLVTDEEFPRSIRFCVNQIDDALHSISGSSHGHFANEAERLSGRLRSSFAYNTIDDIFQQGLHEYLDQVQLRLMEVTNAVYQAYCNWWTRKRA